MPDLVARDYEAVVDSGTLSLELQTDQSAALEALFASRTGDAPSQPARVIDLAMMGYVLEGGLRHQLRGRPSALYAYRGADGQRIVCQMYEGRLEDLPPEAEVRRNGPFTFRIYRQGSMSLVFWQEGDIVCVLVSRLPLEDVVQLAFAKAMLPA